MVARTVPVMPAEAPGNYNTGALFGATTKALGDFATNVPRFKGYATTAQALATGTTLIPISLDAERYDSDGGHSVVTNTSRYVVQVPGTYEMKGCLGFIGSATGNRAVGIMVNGNSVLGSITQLSTVSGNSFAATVSCEELLAAGDYIELAAWQTSGAPLNTSVTTAFGPVLSAIWVSN
jgi:hypothetical protein